MVEQPCYPQSAAGSRRYGPAIVAHDSCANIQAAESQKSPDSANVAQKFHSRANAAIHAQKSRASSAIVAQAFNRLKVEKVMLSANVAQKFHSRATLFKNCSPGTKATK